MQNSVSQNRVGLVRGLEARRQRDHLHLLCLANLVQRRTRLRCSLGQVPQRRRYIMVETAPAEHHRAGVRTFIGSSSAGFGSLVLQWSSKRQHNCAKPKREQQRYLLQSNPSKMEKLGTDPGALKYKTANHELRLSFPGLRGTTRKECLIRLRSKLFCTINFVSQNFSLHPSSVFQLFSTPKAVPSKAKLS